MKIFVGADDPQKNLVWVIRRFVGVDVLRENLFWVVRRSVGVGNLQENFFLGCKRNREFLFDDDPKKIYYEEIHGR